MLESHKQLTQHQHQTHHHHTHQKHINYNKTLLLHQHHDHHNQHTRNHHTTITTNNIKITLDIKLQQQQQHRTNNKSLLNHIKRILIIQKRYDQDHITHNNTARPHKNATTPVLPIIHKQHAFKTTNKTRNIKLHRNQIKHRLIYNEHTKINKTLENIITTTEFDHAQIHQNQIPERQLNKYKPYTTVFQNKHNNTNYELNIDQYQHHANTHTAKQHNNKFNTIKRQNTNAIAGLKPNTHKTAHHRITQHIELAITNTAQLLQIIKIDYHNALLINIHNEQQTEIARITAQLEHNK